MDSANQKLARLDTNLLELRDKRQSEHHEITAVTEQIEAQKKSKGMPDDAFRIRGLWRTDLLFRTNPEERTFNYTFLIIQTVGEGACYCSTIPQLIEGFHLLGKDARTV